MKKNVTWGVLILLNNSSLMHLIIMLGDHGKTMAFLFLALSKEQSKSKLHKNTVRCKTNL